MLQYARTKLSRLWLSVRSPIARSLILTHIFGKSLDKGIAKAEIISISTMTIVLPGSFTKSICKMWVKDRARSQGLVYCGWRYTRLLQGRYPVQARYGNVLHLGMNV